MGRPSTGDRMDLSIEVSWYRIWSVVARSGDISGELDQHVAMCRRSGDDREPDQIRADVVEQINRAIQLNQAQEKQQAMRNVIDAAVRRSMERVNGDDVST